MKYSKDITKLKTPANYASSKGVSRSTVYLWIKDNLVKHLKIDGVIFIDTSDVSPPKK